MARVWGNTTAIFWNMDDIPSGAPVDVDGVMEPRLVEDSIEWTRLLSQIGNGRASFYADDGWDDYIVPGRIVAITQAVTGYSFTSRLLAVFIIEEMEPTTRNGISIVDVRGPGVEGLLTKYPVWSPIGEEVIIEAELTAGAGVDTTTLADGAPAGNDSAELASVSGVAAGDEVRIRMGASNDGAWHVATITAVNPPGAPANVIQFAPDIPANAADGNSVEVRPAVLSLDTVANMTVNQRIEVTLNSAAVFTSIILSVDSAAKTVTIRDGLTSNANSGNAVNVYDYSAPSISDVTQIVQNAESWGVLFQTGNGTADGTAHVPQGESVFDLLSSTAERTGEFFRYYVLISNIPTRAIQWRRTPDSSGMTIKMYDTNQYALQVTDELSETKGAAFDIRRKVSVPLITRIYPSAGDQVITLSQCTNDALSIALTAGCYVTISDDLYEPDYVTYGIGHSAYGNLAIRETYGDISISDAGNLSEVQAASDALLLSAVNTLVQAHLREYFTVEAYLPQPVMPGQTIKIENLTRVEPWVDTNTDYIVLEVVESQANGRPRTRLTVSNQLGLRRTSANTFATTIRSTVQGIRRVGKAAMGVTGRGVTVIGAGGGGLATDHGTLTGLLDDDHTQYLPVTGGRTMTGNLPVAAGVTIDGVDVSVHAANPAAHHAPVTALNYGVTLSGQAVGARLSSYNPGLRIEQNDPAQGLAVLLQSPSGLELAATGLGLADAAAGEGLKMVYKTLHVDLSVNSGLQINTDQLTLGQPTALSAVSTSAVTGASHSHAVTNTADGQTNPNTLLKSGAAGELRLERMSLGASNSGTDTLLVQPTTPTRAGQRIRAASGQSAPLWRIENSTGQALILLTGDGSLESGNPGFTSGLTGWQITAGGDAEFNNAFIRGELHAAVFVADEMHATGGTLAVMTASKVADPVNPNDNKTPTTTAAFVLNIQASWDTALSYFSNGDVLRVKTTNQLGGGLDISDFYLTVNTIGALTGRDLANGKPGYYPTTVTRRSGTGGVVIPAGSAVVRWGKTGQAAGSFTGALLLTADLNQAPYLDVFTVPSDRTAAEWGNPQAAGVLPTPRVRLGNLDGVLGLPEQWGIAAGTNLSDTAATARYLVASDKQLRLNNVDLYLYNGASPTVEWLSSGNLKVGTNIGSDLTTALRFEAGTGALRIGAYGAGKPNLFWDGSSLALRHHNQDVIKLNADGSSQFAGVMQIGAAGGIWQAAAGTFAAPRGGLKIWNSNGAGRLATYASDGSQQIYIDSEGQLIAGNGEVVLNSGGLRIKGTVSESGIRYFNTSNAEFGRVLSVAGADWSIMGLRAWKPGIGNLGTYQSYLGLHANSVEGYKIQLATASPSEGANLVEITPTATDFRYRGLRLEKGLLVGSLYWGAPTAEGVIRFVERADSNTYPNYYQVDVFARTVGGVQKLYAKFGNGVVRELAAS